MSDRLDDELRSRLKRSGGGALDARSALHGMAPTLRSARRRSQLRAGVSGLAVVLATSGMAVALTSQNQDGEQTTVLATAPLDSSTTGPVTSTAESVATSTTDEPGATTVRPGVAVTPSTDSRSGDEPEPFVVSTTTTVNPTSGSGQTSTTTTTATSTTDPGSTTMTSGSVEPSLVQSGCGYLEVEVVDDGIRLIRSVPNPDYEVDEKNAGPEKVEVSFEGPDGHCEIEAEVRDGVLTTDISSE